MAHYTHLCPLELAEALNAMSLTIYRTKPTKWNVMEEPAFSINIHTIPSDGHIVAEFAINKKILSFLDWIDKLEQIALIRQTLIRGGY